MASPVTEIADPIAAIVAYLRAQASLQAMVNDRILGDSIPPSSAQIKNAVTIRLAGGPAEIYIEQVIRPRIEVRAYGETDEEAATIFWEVYRLLNGKINLIANDTRIMSFAFAGNGTTLFDEDVNKPFKLAYAETHIQANKLSAA